MAGKRGKQDAFWVDQVKIEKDRPPREPGGHPTWRARWTDAAGRHEKGLGRTDRSGAKATWDALLKSGDVRITKAGGPIVTIKHLMTWWLGWQDDRLAAKEIRPGHHLLIENAAGLIDGRIGETRVRVFNVTHVYDFVTGLRASGRSGNYARDIAYKLVGAWNEAVSRGLIDGRPIEAAIKREKPIRPQRAQPVESIRAVIAALDGAKRTFVRVVAVTGMRPAEAAMMLRSDLVDVVLRDGRGKARTVTIYRLRDDEGAKTGGREIPLPADVAAELRALPDLTSDGALFSRHMGGSVNRALRRRGIAWTMTALRKTKTTAMYGVTDPRTEADALGHDPAMAVRVYMESHALDILDAFEATRPDILPDGKVLQIGGRVRGPRRGNTDGR